MLVRRKQCCVPGCDKSNETEPNILYFHFPKNPEIAKEWLKVIKNAEIQSINEIKTKHRICAKHFEDRQFQTPERKKLLRKQIPRLFLSDNGNDEKNVDGDNNNMKEEIEIIKLLGDDFGEDFQQDVEIQYEENLSEIIIEEGKPEIVANKEYKFSSVKMYYNDNISDVCRICLKPVDDNCLIKLLDSANEESEGIRNNIKELFPDIDLDLYPDQVICEKCSELIQSSYELKQTYQKSQELLNNLIPNQQSGNKQSTDIILCHGKTNKETDLKHIVTIVQQNKQIQQLPTDLPDPIEENDNMTSSGRILCDLCGEILDNNRKYYKHLKNHQKFQTKLKCLICKRLIPLNFFKKHQLLHRKCKICLKMFLNLKLIRKHYQEKHPDKNLNKYCLICGLKFLNNFELIRHNKQLHQRKFHCIICNQVFRTLNDFKKHLSEHAQSSQLRMSKNNCSITDDISTKKLLQKSVKKFVLLNSNPNSVYFCQICNISFIKRTKLLEHRNMYHRNL